MGGQPGRPFYPVDAELAGVRLLLLSVQHVFAMLAGIVAPGLVVAAALDMSVEETARLVSASLLGSGIATLIQAGGVGPLGSRLLSVQGTSFTFVPVAIAAGQVGGAPLIFGMALICAPVELLLSRFLVPLRGWFPPVVTGTVVMMIGLSLIGVGMTDLAGGHGAEGFGSWRNFGLGLLVMLTILALGSWRNGRFAPLSVGAGLLFGWAVSELFVRTDLSVMAHASWMDLPKPLAQGLAFDAVFLLPWCIAYVVTALETVGDLTATSRVSREPIEGPLFIRRIKGGVAADGVGSAIAAVFGSLPVTTFSQNNGVIALTGVAARRVGLGAGACLLVLACIPKLATGVSLIPKPVLGGATLLLFATVAVSGISIVGKGGWTPRKEKIVALSLGLGLGVTMVPEATAGLVLSEDLLLRSLGVIATSGMAVSALAALTLNRLLPETEPVSQEWPSEGSS